MEKKIRFYTRLGFLLSALLGVFLHFFYRLAGKSIWVGLVSPINESVWEHMKLIFFPLTIYFLFEIIRFKKKIYALPMASAWGILAGTFSIPLIFYTYTGILGRHMLAADIAVYLLGIFLGFYTQRKIIRQSSFPPVGNRFLPWGLVALTVLCFFTFTFQPPSLPLFSRF